MFCLMLFAGFIFFNPAIQLLSIMTRVHCTGPEVQKIQQYNRVIVKFIQAYDQTKIKMEL